MLQHRRQLPAEARELSSPASKRTAARLFKPLLMGVVAVGVLAPGSAAYAEPSIEQIERQIASESTRLEKVVEEYNRVGEELKASLVAAAALATKLAPLKAQLDRASDAVAALAAHAYKGGSLAEISAVLSSPDPAVVVDRLQTLEQIAKFENAKMIDVASARGRHDVEAARLAVLIESQKQQRQTLADQKQKINSDLAKLFELRRKAYGNQAPAPSGAGATPPYVAGKAGKAVNYAYAALGKPYAWGAAGPKSYDCSGLTMAAWATAGVKLPHNAKMQWNALPHISRGQLQPGDLVFYSGLGHVGIYVGSGKIIHSPTFGDVVRIASVDVMSPYGYARPS